MGLVGQSHTPAALLPGMTQCPLHSTLVGPHDRSALNQRDNILLSVYNRPLTVSYFPIRTFLQIKRNNNNSFNE